MLASWLPLISVAAYVTLLLVAAVIDIRTHLIPNRLSYPAIAFAFLARSLRHDLSTGLVGAAVGAFVMIVPVLIYGPDRAGIGDVKWAAFIGLFVGFPAVLVALSVAALGLVCLGLLRLATGQRVVGATAPFAPFLCVGGVCALVFLMF